MVEINHYFYFCNVQIIKNVKIAICTLQFKINVISLQHISTL